MAMVAGPGPLSMRVGLHNDAGAHCLRRGLFADHGHGMCVDIGDQVHPPGVCMGAGPGPLWMSRPRKPTLRATGALNPTLRTASSLILVITRPSADRVHRPSLPPSPSGAA